MTKSPGMARKATAVRGKRSTSDGAKALSVWRNQGLIKAEMPAGGSEDKARTPGRQVRSRLRSPAPGDAPTAGNIVDVVRSEERSQEHALLRRNRNMVLRK
jgi:hypothetical protein